MFKKILVPVDGSPTSQQAVSRAVALAKAFDAEVFAIYVIDPYPFTGVGTDFAYGQSQYLEAATFEANNAIRGAREAIEASGVKVDTRVVEANAPWRGILETATELGADLIVMGSHGRRGLEKLVLGSVAQRVLSHAHLPVMVVRD
ncbi:MAG: universal stress protein [Burkholderiaceae bacterium]|nr:universal stress protein [Burkholderiaceae bacterium]